jgi:hypothetical protein
MPRELMHRAAFESHGETYVRMLAQQGGDVGAEAIAWLAEQQALREEAAASKRDAREEETLTLARDANNIARRAERWAMYAAVAAVIALVVSVVRGS